MPPVDRFESTFILSLDPARASMQVRMAKCRAGGMARSPFLPKPAAYCWLAERTSWRTLLLMGNGSFAVKNKQLAAMAAVP